LKLHNSLLTTIYFLKFQLSTLFYFTPLNGSKMLPSGPANVWLIIYCCVNYLRYERGKNHGIFLGITQFHGTEGNG